MLLFPNAKINLGLNIVGRRADGYHDIETVFYPIPLTDTLTVELAKEFSFAQTGNTLDCLPDDNLVVRAVKAYAAYSGCSDIEQAASGACADAGMPPVALALDKRIPSGAGLGGGSSDAAFAVKGVRQLMGRRDDDTVLEALLSHLGADCPFFVRNRPVFATGIGNVFAPISLSLSGWQLALVKPDIHVSTREAYAAVHPCRPCVSLTEVVARPVEEWQHSMFNDFEPSVFAAHPEIAHIKARLIGLGATYASMSGSGSAVFGLFRHQTTLPNLKEAFPQCFTWVGQLP